MTSHKTAPAGPFGVAARFENVSDLVAAAHRAREAGYTKMDAYTPFPVHELDEALAIPRTVLPKLVFGAGLAGCIGGFAMQYWMAAVDYPLNIGGKPLNSWPQWVPVAYECTILLAALTAVFGLFLLNGFPEPYHPMFNVKGFDRVSTDAFFLCIEATDPKFDRDATRRFLQQLHASEVTDVEP